MKNGRRISLIAKRTIDIVGASFALVVTAPLLAGVGLAILRGHGHPVLFSQDRPGLNGRPFRLYKFRTMTSDVGPDRELLSDEERLTPLGELLRRWSIDELPELWNIVKGDMSLVGPRPLLVDYLSLYTPEQARRHEMRPGLTGLAQIRGRNHQSWAERFALDVWYVDHWSLRLDAKILAQTVLKVLSQDGISASGEATMTRFEGHLNG